MEGASGPQDEPDEWEVLARARLGTVLDSRWRLTEILGIGGSATVYGAENTAGQQAAAKILRPDYALRTSSRQRFLREAELAARVQHPGAVRVFNAGVQDDCVFLLMERLSGETLGSRLRRQGGVLPLRPATRLGLSVLEVLVEAHAAQVIHRDIKPDNIFFTRDEQVKVLDFGLGRWDGPESSEGLTKSRATLGTPAFMSPEQALGRSKEVDARSDLWALGATLFFATTGRRVHGGTTAGELIVAASTQQVIAIREIVNDIPDDLASIIDRALAFHRQDRLQSAEEMLRELESIQLLSDPSPLWDQLTPAQEEAARDRALGTATLPESVEPAQTSAAGSMMVPSRSAADESATSAKKTGRMFNVAAGGLLLGAVVWAWSQLAPQEDPDDLQTQRSGVVRKVNERPQQEKSPEAPPPEQLAPKTAPPPVADTPPDPSPKRAATKPVTKPTSRNARSTSAARRHLPTSPPQPTPSTAKPPRKSNPALTWEEALQRRKPD